MYSRYTAFHFDENDRQQVLEFWEKVGGPSAQAQEGWRGALILESIETPGRLRTVTLWESREAFDRYYASDEHKRLGGAIGQTGLKIDDRDGLTALFDARPTGSILRVTQARLKLDRHDQAIAFWRSTGGSLIRRQPGCLRAEAYWAADSGYFTVVIEWRSVADAERFKASDGHRQFAAGLDPVVEEIVGRQTWERV